MTLSVFFLVVLAAFFHASWNIIVKGGQNKLYEIGLNALGGGVGGLFLLPFAPLPGLTELMFLCLSCLGHLGYYYCMAITYKAADLSLGYPIMRGAAPVITALVLSMLGVKLGIYGWAGILCICAGILAMAMHQLSAHKDDLRGIFLALRTSLMITAYTLADGYGARIAGDSLGYAAWLFFLNALPIHCYLLTTQGRSYLAYIEKRGKKGLAGGLCSLASYGIAIWAMTMAPIALVAALRETSVLFGMILAVIFLGEKITPLKVIATLLMLAGAMIVRLD